MSQLQIRELAYAKLNLVLRVGRPRPDGLHPISSIFASIDLADDVQVAPADAREDSIECPGVHGPNLVAAALAAFRRCVPTLPSLEVRIAKRIPVAAGLGGGSADAAAVLRAANAIAGEPLDRFALRQIAAELGSDVPSQVEPRHAVVRGLGEIVEAIELPQFAAVLVPQDEGLSTAAVYAEFDRTGGWRRDLDAEALRAAADHGLARILENDLQAAALALRPELSGALDALTTAGAAGALVSGSGPTCFGLFEDRASAERAARGIPGALVVQSRSP
jgi:4-diphosphocytidyl-2-C-methyl-D-erythritol kinase